MLVYFKIKNFLSFKDEATLYMEAQEEIDLPSKYLQRVDLKNNEQKSIFRTAGIYGANASGKSNFMRGFSVLNNLVRSSSGYNTKEDFLEDSPTPFKLNSSNLSAPTVFEIQLLINGNLYTYTITLSSEKILEETLRHETKHEIIFKRNTETDSFEISSTFFEGGQLQITPELRIALYKEEITEYQLFLSFSERLKNTELLYIFNWFNNIANLSKSHVRFMGYYSPSPSLFLDEKKLSSLVSALKRADFGIKNIQVTEEKQLIEIRERLRFHRLSPEDISVEFENGFNLGYHEMSEGTRTFAYLYSGLERVLLHGGLLLIDEIESNLHPELCKEIIRTFQVQENSEKQPQLIFTSHDIDLLDDKSLFRPDQIWICDKDRETYASTIVSPAEFEGVDWQNTSVLDLYKENRFGGYPFIQKLL